MTLLAGLALLTLVAAGTHIAVALAATAMLTVYLTSGSVDVTLSLLSSTFYESLRDYIFAVIPLFMLMGEFISRSGIAGDVFEGINQLLRRVRGRLALATVLGNAVFAFVTGVSIAAAAAFSRISYPEMRRQGYARSFALGSIAGSACLGMLIPPSVLMIIWGVLTDESIGRLFLAGVVPGLVLTVLFCGYVIAAAWLRPALVGGVAGDAKPAPVGGVAGDAKPAPAAPDLRRIVAGSTYLVAIVAAVLGGIWGGWFTPTEAAAIGTLLSLAVACARGLTVRAFIDAVLTAGRVSAPLLVLLMAAQFYGRALAFTGIGSSIQSMFIDSGLAPGLVVVAMVGVWFVLGMFIDSASIMLLTVPIFAPIAKALGIDPVAFAIMGILAIEAGLLTPPFGVLVFTVKASVDEAGVTLGEIFWGAVPYWICLLLVVVAVWVVPTLATGLPHLLLEK